MHEVQVRKYLVINGQIYRYLPNGRVSAAGVFPGAMFAGLFADVARGLYMVALPWLDLPRSQGPFYVSISFVLLAPRIVIGFPDDLHERHVYLALALGAIALGSLVFPRETPCAS